MSHENARGKFIYLYVHNIYISALDAWIGNVIGNVIGSVMAMGNVERALSSFVEQQLSWFAMVVLCVSPCGSYVGNLAQDHFISHLVNSRGGHDAFF